MEPLETNKEISSCEITYLTFKTFVFIHFYHLH